MIFFYQFFVNDIFSCACSFTIATVAICEKSKHHHYNFEYLLFNFIKPATSHRCLLKLFVSLFNIIHVKKMIFFHYCIILLSQCNDTTYRKVHQECYFLRGRGIHWCHKFVKDHNSEQLMDKIYVTNNPLLN